MGEQTKEEKICEVGEVMSFQSDFNLLFVFLCPDVCWLLLAIHTIWNDIFFQTISDVLSYAFRHFSSPSCWLHLALAGPLADIVHCIHSLAFLFLVLLHFPTGQSRSVSLRFGAKNHGFCWF